MKYGTHVGLKLRIYKYSLYMDISDQPLVLNCSLEKVWAYYVIVDREARLHSSVLMRQNKYQLHDFPQICEIGFVKEFCIESVQPLSKLKFFAATYIRMIGEQFVELSTTLIADRRRYVTFLE